ncbi:MAG: hypothetical protein ACU0DK_00350 [Pseudooceanicola sp.]
MKLCLIGNSHVAMLMLAHRDAALAREVSLTCFAKPSGGPDSAVLDGTRIAAPDADLRARLDSLGTPHELDLADFDAVVFVGETISVFSAVAMVRKHLVSDWPSARERITAEGDPLTPPPKRALMSPAALHAGLVMANRAKLTYRLAARLRDATDMPLIVLPQPYPAARITGQKAKYPMFHRIAKSGDGPALAAALTAAQADSFAGIRDITLLSQPRETIEAGFLTRNVFARGASRLSMKDTLPEDDVLHAGAEYGGLMLRRILAAAAR